MPNALLALHFKLQSCCDLMRICRVSVVIDHRSR